MWFFDTDLSDRDLGVATEQKIANALESLEVGQKLVLFHTEQPDEPAFEGFAVTRADSDDEYGWVIQREVA